jgi:hypothetical protein
MGLRLKPCQFELLAQLGATEAGQQESRQADLKAAERRPVVCLYNKINFSRRTAYTRSLIAIATRAQAYNLLAVAKLRL